jgi:hypothetical protein
MLIFDDYFGEFVGGYSGVDLALMIVARGFLRVWSCVWSRG